MLSLAPFKTIIDISQPVHRKTACFPGDKPFSFDMTVTFEQSSVINLSAFSMSPHVGTHVDAPGHIKGSMSDSFNMVGQMELNPFVGEALVIDISPFTGPIEWSHISHLLPQDSKGIERLLIKTQKKIRYEVFESDYAYLSRELATILAERGLRLFGLDAPSLDDQKSKTLDAHHALDLGGLVWLENLDLSEVDAGTYFLVALPIKFMELEASPVRAVLLV